MIQERFRDVLDKVRNNLYSNVLDREYSDLKGRIAFLEFQMKVKDEQIHARDSPINGLI